MTANIRNWSQLQSAFSVLWNNAKARTLQNHLLRERRQEGTEKKNKFSHRFSSQSNKNSRNEFQISFPLLVNQIHKGLNLFLRFSLVFFLFSFTECKSNWRIIDGEKIFMLCKLPSACNRSWNARQKLIYSASWLRWWMKKIEMEKKEENLKSFSRLYTSQYIGKSHLRRLQFTLWLVIDRRILMSRL